MGYKVDELIESMKAEESAGNTPPSETNTPPSEDTPKETEPKQETPPAEPKPGEDDDKGGNGGEPPKQKEDDDRFSRAEFSFRRKLEKDPAMPEYITTEIGVGYRMIDLAGGSGSTRGQ
jgi:hypothetical protein